MRILERVALSEAEEGIEQQIAIGSGLQSLGAETGSASILDRGLMAK